MAWKVIGADLYTVWNIDGNGNYTTNAIAIVSGSNGAFEGFEGSFHQDLNGDGIIGVRTTVVDQVALNYFLDGVGSGAGTGPELKYGGSPVTAGQFGGWRPIATEATANGYDIAWKVYGPRPVHHLESRQQRQLRRQCHRGGLGNSGSIEGFEPIFHQDLNGDSVIGVPSSTNPAAAQLMAASGQTIFDGKTLNLTMPSTFD